MSGFDVVVRRARDDPFELFVGVLCALAGIPLVLGHIQPASVDALMPNWLAVLWGVMVLAGGSAVTVGMFLRGLALEQSGLIWLSGSCAAYAVCALAYGRSAGAFAAALLFGLSAACTLRALEYSRVMRGASGSRSPE